MKNFPQFVVIHTVKGFGIVNKAEVNVFLELSCSFYDPMDVGNLISGSSAFSKPSLYIWKFLVRVLLKPRLKDFVHCLASMWSMCNCLVVWAFFSIALLWDWNKTDLFQACGHCRIFQICWRNRSLFWHWRKTACVNYMKTTQHLLMGFQGQFWLCVIFAI